MNYPQANQAYTEAAVLSAPPEQWVVMLYDGAIRFLQQGAVALEKDQVGIARDRLYRAEQIINELNSSLRDEPDPKFSSEMRSYYLLFKREIMQALITQDASKIKATINIMRELREAWSGAAANLLAAGV